MENLNIVSEDYRKYFVSKVTKHLLDCYCDNTDDSFKYEDYKAGIEKLELCTINQILALYFNYVAYKTNISINKYSNPTDHLAINLNGMYVGIEPDGYTHS